MYTCGYGLNFEEERRGYKRKTKGRNEIKNLCLSLCHLTTELIWRPRPKRPGGNEGTAMSHGIFSWPVGEDRPAEGGNPGDEGARPALVPSGAEQDLLAQGRRAGLRLQWEGDAGSGEQGSSERGVSPCPGLRHPRVGSVVSVTRSQRKTGRGTSQTQTVHTSAVAHCSESSDGASAARPPPTRDGSVPLSSVPTLHVLPTGRPLGSV